MLNAAGIARILKLFSMPNHRKITFMGKSVKSFIRGNLPPRQLTGCNAPEVS